MATTATMRRWVQLAEAVAPEVLEDPDADGLSDDEVLAAAIAANDRHRFPLALRWAERAIHRLPVGQAGAAAQLQLGVAAVHLGAARTALEACEGGLQQLGPDDDRFLRAELTAQRGVCERRLGMSARALPSYQAALDLLEGLEHDAARELRGVLHNNLGILHQRRGDDQSALEHVERGIEAVRTLTHPGLAVIQQHLNLGRILLGRNELAAASRHLEQAVALATTAPAGVQARAWEALAHAELARGDTAAAERALEPALAHWDPTDEPLMYAATRLTQARVHAAAGQPDTEALLTEVERIANELADPDLLSDVASEWAAWCELNKRFEEACGWHRAHRARVARQLDELRDRTVEELRLAHEMETRERERNDALRAARDEALRANAAKTTFLARVSHELRTPLTGILGLTDLVIDELEDGADPSTLSADVQGIRRGGSHLLRLIDRLLQLTSLASGEVEAAHPVDLQRLIDGVLQRADATATELARPLQGFVDPQLGSTPVLVQELHLRSVLDELVDNALRFGTGPVQVYARRNGDGLEVAVHDQGRGLPEGGLARWSQAFTQADPSPTREREGLGLGLSLARQHAERLEGMLVARDEDGLTVGVHLPLRYA